MGQQVERFREHFREHPPLGCSWRDGYDQDLEKGGQLCQHRSVSDPGKDVDLRVITEP